ncbi:MAG: hypothetical protein ACTHW2_02650, partial [Tissierella sp.]|uniref:hypothetical protein n=1 Tax=Tissierella sp. TaxID=41274 RepID=UPI003F9E3F0F
MLKRFKVLSLSLSIIILGSSVVGASSFRNNYNRFTNYNVNSNFYDTYTARSYNYTWDVSIWN